MKARAQLDAMLDTLDAELPAMLEQFPDAGGFWAALYRILDDKRHPFYEYKIAA